MVCNFYKGQELHAWYLYCKQPNVAIYVLWHFMAFSTSFVCKKNWKNKKCQSTSIVTFDCLQ